MRGLSTCALALLASSLAGATAARAESLVAACTAGTGSAESLVQAVAAANAKPGPDTIVLGARCAYTLTSPDNDWYGPNGLPPIVSEITIEGNGATIARGGETPFRLFFVGADPASKYVTPGAEPGALTLRDLVLSGGLAKGGDSNGGGGGAGLGGAIFSQGTVTIEGSTIAGNRAVGGSSQNAAAGRGGGGIGESAPFGSAAGGGFGAGEFPGGEGGSAVTEAAGGGAGFLTEGEDGLAGEATAGGPGGGLTTGLGGSGSGPEGGPGGDGSGGGGGTSGAEPSEPPGAGGNFGGGGKGAGGGGGVGGGGAANGISPGSTTKSAGGGGFGGGGGAAGAATGAGGGGGFGGGGGSSGEGEAPAGFGGGVGGSGGGGGGGSGMGGAVFDMQGTLTVENSTFAGNSASGGESKLHPGQGIAGAVFDLNGTFTSTGSTFAGNEATDRASQIYTLALDDSQERKAQTTLRDTIVSDGQGAEVELGSTEAGALNQSVAQTDVSQFDLVRQVESAEEGTVVGPLASTADPLLGPLQDNGGPTSTMALLPGSPAIDAGKSFGLPTDQRGMARPIDFAGLANPEGGDGTDIGAFEVQPLCAKATLPYAECPAEAEPGKEATQPPPTTKPSETPATPKSPGTLSAVARQKLGGAIVVSFLCKAASCKVSLAADIVYGKKHLRATLGAKIVKQGRKQRFSIAITKQSRRLLAKALAHHTGVTANVIATVTYADGRAKAGPLGIRLVR